MSNEEVFLLAGEVIGYFDILRFFIRDGIFGFRSTAYSLMTEKDLYREHIKSYEYQFKQISFRYDMDEDGRADDVEKRKAGFPMISTTNPPSRYHRFKYRRF